MGAPFKMIKTEKRVACLYRVSSKGQLKGEDIPSQRRSCLEFIESKPGWVFAKEYIEKAVSGFKVSASKRDVIQEAKADAENGLFDVLLVFMFDRLGRREDETPFVLEWFVKKGIEMWSVMEGQQKFEDHTDHLINYVRFWQSSGESKKTSMRVRENIDQMAEDGIFTGGRAGYGYELVPSGIKNKKGKELFKRKIVPEDALIVDELYSLSEQGFGGNRIAKFMNTERDPFVPSPTGGQWTSGAINFILRNPLYKGYPALGKRNSEMGVFNMQNPEDWILPKKQIQDLVIIQEDRWDRHKLFRSKRAPNKKSDTNDRGYQINISKSPLLLVGVINCGHCGAPLTTTYNRKKYKLASGEVKVWKSPKYRCSGKASGKICDGQTIYSPNRIEPAVLEEIEIYLEQLKKVDFTSQINSFRKKNVDVDLKEQKRLQKEMHEKQKELDALTSEVTKSIMGKSSFNPDLLNSLINQKNDEIEKLTIILSSIDQQIKEKKVEVAEMEFLKKSIPSWKDVFNKAPLEKKKLMLSTIIGNVVVTKNNIEINVKLSIEHFCNSLYSSEINSLGRAHRWQR